jgi:hypothetical protein
MQNENALCYLVGYIRKRYEHHYVGLTPSTVVEIGTFLSGLLGKKLRNRSAANESDRRIVRLPRKRVRD